MDLRALKHHHGGWLLAVTVVAGLAGLGLLTEAMQQSADNGRWHTIVFLANGAGALALLGVLLVNLLSLLRQRRRRIPGAGLKLRLLGAFAAVAAAPVLMVFLVAVQFLHRGIESWVDDSIALELGRSLRLSRGVLDAELRTSLQRTRAAAARLAVLSEEAMIHVLPALRAEMRATEMGVFAPNYRIVATSSETASGHLPALPGEDVLLQLPRDGSYVAIEPVDAGAMRVRAAVIIRVPASGEQLILQALYPIDSELGALVGSVQKIYTRYRGAVFLSEPLESTFTMALAVVLLLALFMALYGALLFAGRLVAPIRNLVAGTRAVAAGRMDTRLPVAVRDDIGLLVESFNDMAARLGAASEEARRSAEQNERAHASLATVLAHLTAGVLAIDARGCLRTVNEAAERILCARLRDAVGQSVERIVADQPVLRGFFDACVTRNGSAPEGWREQLVLPGASGARRVLMCSAAPLPIEPGEDRGFVLVFEDITAMLQAQREAAWREVARRLAHEINNPLTPIQLSAERLRRRYLGSLPAADAELLDRATHTIVQQVAALRDMVHAFGEYARAPDVHFVALDLDTLVREVADLYQGPQLPEIRLDLDAALGTIEADALRLRQLLHNLLRNACEALEQTAVPRIVIATRRCGDGERKRVEISVRDNGPGIEPAILERVFEPYVTSKRRGSGLGLAIVRRLVEEHGGSIAAENPADGGACIRVVLPVSQDGDERSGDQRPRCAGERRQPS